MASENGPKPGFRDYLMQVVQADVSGIIRFRSGAAAPEHLDINGQSLDDAKRLRDAITETETPDYAIEAAVIDEQAASNW